MATDYTEVPVGKVIGIGLLSLGILVGVHVGIWGYYYSMYGDEFQRKVLGTTSSTLTHEREDESRRLAGIDQAMQQVAASVGTEQRPSAIAPHASTDMQPLQGWQMRPRVVPTRPPAQGDLPAGATAPLPTPNAPPVAPAPGANLNAPAPAVPAAPAAHPAVNGAPVAHPAVNGAPAAHPAINAAAAHPAPTNVAAPH